MKESSVVRFFLAKVHTRHDRYLYAVDDNLEIFHVNSKEGIKKILKDIISDELYAKIIIFFQNNRSFFINVEENTIFEVKFNSEEELRKLRAELRTFPEKKIKRIFKDYQEGMRKEVDSTPRF